HGLPSLAAMRSVLKLKPLAAFKDVNKNAVTTARLDAAYESPADIDLWIGGLAEADVPGAMVGPTFHKILADQFQRLRDGDRFWYQRYLPPQLIRLVEQQTLSEVVRRNTAIKGEMGPKAFLAPPPKKTKK
ncbi:MAG TPA: peroxidase family protein, partial [Prosthecobacter sp.]